MGYKANISHSLAETQIGVMPINKDLT